MLAVARIAHVSWWRRLRAWARAKLHRCTECRVFSTDEGIGGRCVQCGRIYGWMTRDEMRRSELMPHIVPLRPFAWTKGDPVRLPIAGPGIPVKR